MQVELDNVGGQHDGRRMISVFEQRVFHGLRAIDEQSAEQSVLLLGNPVSPAVAADDDKI